MCKCEQFQYLQSEKNYVNCFTVNIEKFFEALFAYIIIVLNIIQIFKKCFTQITTVYHNYHNFFSPLKS